jgi:hypothetical protein
MNDEDFDEGMALERVSEIGQAFANDYHDGEAGPEDNNIAFEGVIVTERGADDILVYNATLEDDTEVQFAWLLTRVTL